MKTIYDFGFTECWEDNNGKKHYALLHLDSFDEDIVYVVFKNQERIYWSLSIMAPVGYFGQSIDSVFGHEFKKNILSLTNSRNIKIILENNLAGPNGEWVTLKEIKRLYKNPNK